MKLYNLENRIKPLLETIPATREDDWLLIYYVYLDIIGDELRNMSFAEVMVNHLDYQLPAFSAITRCRRKIFENNHNLKGNQEIREEEEKKYKAYALEG